MRLSDLESEIGSEGARAACRVEWEDSERPSLDLVFETRGEAAATFSADPNAFLLGAILPSFRRQERRLSIPGSVCPRLRDGLYAAMGILKSWFAPGRRLTEIEPSRAWRPAARAARPEGALFLTGGVDSLYALWRNRRLYPRNHPASFRSAIYVPSFAFPEESPSDRTRDLVGRQLRSIAAIARAEGLRLLTPTTNLRRLDADGYFTAREGLSAILASTAHLFSASLTSASIAPGLAATDETPCGYHPLLGPLYSTSGLQILHDWTISERLGKIRQISDWNTALANLMVCFEGPLPDGAGNCGRCEKCLRTMTELLVCGALDRCAAFPKRRIEPDDIEAMGVGYHPSVFSTFWQPLLKPLEESGRGDLRAAIVRKAKRAASVAWLERRREAVRRFDRDRLGGMIRSASRAVRGLPPDRGAP